MLLPEHKFLVEEVGAVERTKDLKHEFRMLVFRKPGYTDEFGEKKGEDDLFEAKAWNKQLAELPALKKGDKVTLVGFGTFSVSKRAARNGRNPQTGAAIKIPASKNPVFKAGKALKDAVNKKKK